MIGLLPAAGQATRMNGLPKYLLPIPGGLSNNLIEFHVYQMDLSGCKEVYIGASDSNFRSLSSVMGEVATIYNAAHHKTMSQTVMSARLDFLYARDHYDESVLFGMPDTYFEDKLAYYKLMDTLTEGAQVAVGLFRARPGQHTKVGMVYMDGEQISDVIDKPVHLGRLEWFWGVLAWQPLFWDCIKPEDPHIGYAIPRAITAGLDVRAVKMDGRYWDCGTPEEYFECIKEIA